MQRLVWSGVVAALMLCAGAARASSPIEPPPPPPMATDMAAVTCSAYAAMRTNGTALLWQHWHAGVQGLPVSRNWVTALGEGMPAACKDAPDRLAAIAAETARRAASVGVEIGIVDYTALTCDALMGFNDNDVVDFLYWLHGYRSGEAGTTVLDPAVLAKVAVEIRGAGCPEGKSLIVEASGLWDRVEAAAAQ